VNTAYEVVLHNPEQAALVFKGQVAPRCRELWAIGEDVALRIMPAEDDKTIKQRNYLHKCVLREIAEQAAPMGEKHDFKVWKEYYRERFLGHKYLVYKDPMTGKKRRRKVRISTEDLGLKAYSKYIDEVSASGATELGVTFSVKNWQSWRD
jgi:hypothetical protein